MSTTSSTCIGSAKHCQATEAGFRILVHDADLEQMQAFTEAWLALPIPVQARFATDEDMTIEEVLEADGNAAFPFCDFLIDASNEAPTTKGTRPNGNDESMTKNQQPVGLSDIAEMSGMTKQAWTQLPGQAPEA